MHPTALHVSSVRAFRTVLEIPDEVDLAVVVVPAAVVVVPATVVVVLAAVVVAVATDDEELSPPQAATIKAAPARTRAERTAERIIT